MRFEPNINLHITDENGQVHKTAISEVKNLNSFVALERATEYESRRQLDEWMESGSLGKKGTYGWDDDAGATFLQRLKEEANDYRYFPDPDLLPVEVDEAWLTRLREQVGELPGNRRERYVTSLKLSVADAGVLSADRATGDFYESVLKHGADPRRVASLLNNAVQQLANRRSVGVSGLSLKPKQLAQVAQLIDDNKLAAASAVMVLEQLLEQDAEPEVVATKLGLIQSSDTTPIDAAIDALLSTNPKAADDYRAGKHAALGSLVGMVMKSGKGLNPKVVQERLKSKLDN